MTASSEKVSAATNQLNETVKVKKTIAIERIRILAVGFAVFDCGNGFKNFVSVRFR